MLTPSQPPDADPHYRVGEKGSALAPLHLVRYRGHCLQFQVNSAQPHALSSIEPSPHLVLAYISRRYLASCHTIQLTTKHHHQPSTPIPPHNPDLSVCCEPEQGVRSKHPRNNGARLTGCSLRSCTFIRDSCNKRSVSEMV